MRRTVSSKLAGVQGDPIFLPFLYHTRTITAPSRRTGPFPLPRPSPSRQLCRYSTSPIRYSDSYSTDSAYLEGKETSSPQETINSSDEPSSYLKHRASKLSKQKRSGTSSRSTLTDAEKRIFSRLADATGDKPRSKGLSQSSHKVVGTHTSARNPHDQEETSEISSIFSSAVQDIHKPSPPVISVGEVEQGEARRIDQPGEATPLRTSGRDTAPESAQLSKIFSKLRAFRDSSVDSSSPENEQLAGIDPFPLAKLIAKREAAKICKELDDAVAAGEGDIGVWEICEEKIFGMLRMINLENVASFPELEAGSKQDGKHARKGSSTHVPSDHAPDVIDIQRVPVEGESPLDIPEHVPVVPVISKVYPVTLLHAAKLLHSNFPMSQYSTQLLDTVKAHGRVSFVMGASVELCNELISFRWRVYSDLSYVVSLLEEMEEAGIEFNWDTLSIVDDIRKQRQMDKYTPGTQDGGPEGGTWWWDSEATRSSYKDLAGWGRGRVGWITRIRAQLRKSQRRNSKLDELSKEIS